MPAESIQVQQEGWHYTIVENAALEDLSLSIYSRMLFVYLSKYAGGSKSCFPSVRTLAQASGISERKVRYSISELETKGYIVKTARKEDGHNLTNVYVLKYIPPKLATDTAQPAGGTAPDAGGVLHDVQEGTAPRAAELKSFKDNHLELKYMIDFDKFWNMYPRKVGKTAALRQYKVRLKEGYTADELFAAAKNYAAECKAKGTESVYIKHASTFLGRDKPFEDYVTDPLEAPGERTLRDYYRERTHVYDDGD